MRFRNPMYLRPLYRVPILSALIFLRFLSVLIFGTIFGLTVKAGGPLALFAWIAVIAGTGIGLCFGHDSSEEYLEEHTTWHRVYAGYPMFHQGYVYWLIALDRRLVPNTRDWSTRCYQLEYGRWEYREVGSE